jgi:hypothetical protein
MDNDRFRFTALSAFAVRDVRFTSIRDVASNVSNAQIATFPGGQAERECWGPDLAV